jgi:glucose-6-phosphate 1-epimerase
MTKSITVSDRRFDIPGTAQLVAGNGGLPKVRITTPEASGEMYLQGAHVTSWRPSGRTEMFFLSSQSRWEDSAAIRGGIPVCFPWFGGKKDDTKAPPHGFVRTQAWQLESIAQVGGAVTVSMVTESNEDTKIWWPDDFRLVHRVTFGSELTLELMVTNSGKTSLRFEEALHTYCGVGDVEKVRVRGLDRVYFLDKTDSNHKRLQQHGDIVIVSETDRVYLNTSDTIELEDPVSRRRIRITKENSHTSVVWNPWIQKARAMPDFADDEWKRMICIETCNVSDFDVALEPGQQHTMKAVLRVADL